MILALAAAVSHEAEDWFSEVAHEVGIEHHHILEKGLPALGFAVVLGTIIFLARRP